MNIHKKNQGGFLEVILVLLVIVALVLGYFIYSTYGKQNIDSGNTSITDGVNSKNDNDTFVPQEGGEYEIGAELLKKALAFPSESATQEERAEHSRLVSTLSESSETVNLTDCNPIPAVLKAKVDTNFRAVNNGSTEVTLYYGNKEHKIPANGDLRLSVASDFGSNAGLYGYACGNRGVVGIVAVYTE